MDGSDSRGRDRSTDDDLDEYVRDDNDGEAYLDVVSGVMRRRRGARRSKSRGPYSLEEKQLIYAWGKLLTAERGMDGELAQVTCRDLVVLFTRLTMLCDKYSYKNCSDMRGVDPHVIMNEMEIAMAEPVEEDVDVYRDLT